MIFFGETVSRLLFVLPDSFFDISGNTNIEGWSLVTNNIDIAGHFYLTFFIDPESRQRRAGKSG